MKKIVVILMLLSLLQIDGIEEKEIKVAIYFSAVKRFAEEVKDAIYYSWIKSNVKYSIKPYIITKRDVIEGRLSSFDVFVIPGSARPYFDAMNPKWRKEVIKFVENGGGYVGICGGANLASMGFNEKLSPNSIINLSILKIANVYVNDQQDEEWQYLWKSNWRHGGPPIKIYIVNNSIPIFKGFYGCNRSIRYWGGPGMYLANSKDPKVGDVVPLAIYAEEPMEVAPLHFWRWENGRWIPYKNVTTDIKGEYAAIATTYGKGRIVLFGPHPERETFFDGHIEEFPVWEKLSPFTWFIYNWIGNKSVISYNWWILRRSIAWAAGIEEMPYASETAAYIEEPRYGIYINGRKIMYNENNIVIGHFSISGKVINATGFLYADENFVGKVKDEFSISLKLSKGKHVFKLIAKNDREEAVNEVKVIVF